MVLKEIRRQQPQPPIEFSVELEADTYRKLEAYLTENPLTLEQVLGLLFLNLVGDMIGGLSNAKQKQAEIGSLLGSAKFHLRVHLDKNLWKEIQPNGDIKWFAIHPKTGEIVEIDAEQAYFWTEEWQKGERAADEDIEAGRYQDFDDVDEFFDTRIP